MHFIMRNTNLNVIQQLGCVEPGLCIGNIYLGHTAKEGFVEQLKNDWIFYTEISV